MVLFAHAPASPTPRPEQSRLIGIDAARAIALIGMLMVHFGPESVPTLAGQTYAFAHGRASILFAVVAGVGIALLSRRPEARGTARLRLVWFAAVLFPLGLALEMLDHPVAVIIHHYAGFFVFGALVLGLPRRWLLALALVWLVVGPSLYLWGRMVDPESFARQSVAVGDTLPEIFAAILWSGPYPLLTWASPLLFGLWLGRQDLRAPRVQIALVMGGLAGALASALAAHLLLDAFGAPADKAAWQMLLVMRPHSEMPLWLANAMAVASTIIGLALVVAGRAPRLMTPLAVVGQGVLSIYVAHLVALHFSKDALQSEAVLPAFLTVLAFVAASWLALVVWRRVLPRGPVELAMHAPWDTWRRQTRPAASARQTALPTPIPHR